MRCRVQSTISRLRSKFPACAKAELIYRATPGNKCNTLSLFAGHGACPSNQHCDIVMCIRFDKLLHSGMQHKLGLIMCLCLVWCSLPELQSCDHVVCELYSPASQDTCASSVALHMHTIRATGLAVLLFLTECSHTDKFGNLICLGLAKSCICCASSVHGPAPTSRPTGM